MGGKSASELVIAGLADAQFGVVSRAQLLSAGLTRNEIDNRIAAQRLRRLWRGVYAVGHRSLRVEGRWMAAVLACGEGAVLSHQTAPAVWELRRVGSGVIHVTVPGDPGRKQREGIRVHRSVTLTERDVTRVRGLPVTTVARTIIDLSRTLSRDELEELVHRADDRGLVDFRDLRAARSASLQAVLQTFDPAPTRSALGAKIPQALPRSRHPTAGGERVHRGLPRRLRLARPKTDRRGRRLRAPRHQE